VNRDLREGCVVSLDRGPDALVPGRGGDDAPAERSLTRAKKLFLFEEAGSGSPFVEKVWSTRGKPAEQFISVALSHWEMVVTRQPGRTYLTVRGPETAASTWPIPDDAEFLGIRFRHGAFMPNLPVGSLVDGMLTLPAASDRSFWLDGSAWEFPRFDDADAFVGRLDRAGLLVHDPVVEGALGGEPMGHSPRSIQRRVLRATGLTQNTIRQIARAEAAVGLLDRGESIAETVARAGYADQAHLTRSLKRFVGETPGQIVGGRQRA
jgi:hypothetical protein